MKRVFTGRGVSEAHLVRAYLENAGIPVIVQGEDLSTVFGGVPIDADSMPSVWVVEDTDFERARALIEESQQEIQEQKRDEEAADTTSWLCPNCGETVGSVLFVCWNCGTERDAK